MVCSIFPPYHTLQIIAESFLQVPGLLHESISSLWRRAFEISPPGSSNALGVYLSSTLHQLHQRRLDALNAVANELTIDSISNSQ